MQRSTKGRCALRVIAGGYKLPRAPEQHTAREVLQLSEKSLAPVTCLCGKGWIRSSMDIWAVLPWRTCCNGKIREMTMVADNTVQR